MYPLRDSINGTVCVIRVTATKTTACDKQPLSNARGKQPLSNV